MQVEGEVQALLARRDFLESDVDHLEQYLVAQRERLVEVAGTLNDLVQRVPGGLADMRRPLLSAAADSSTVDSSDAGDGGDASTLADATRSLDAEIVEPSVDGPADAGPGDEQDEIAEIRASPARTAGATRHRSAERPSATSSRSPSSCRRPNDSRRPA